MTEVVPDLNAGLAARLQALSATAPGAVAATKALLQAGQPPLPAWLDQAAQAFASALRGPEAAAGLQAFARKQAAPWRAPDGSTRA